MTHLLFVHTRSPLHAGTGDSVGAIDLPIARDRATGIPIVPGSSVKGSLRAKALTSNWSATDIANLFGPARDSASDHSGALVVGDANLLLLPVRSLAGTFAYVTSPLLLQRFARDAAEAGLGRDWAIPVPRSVKLCATIRDTSLGTGKNAGTVVIEELDLAKDSGLTDSTTSLATTLSALVFPDRADEVWRMGLSRRLLIVHDDVMSFLCEQATDVVARIALEPEQKTVNKGSLWYQERLPTETVLVAITCGMGNGKLRAAEAVPRLGPLLDTSVQLGGDATTGAGRCRLVLAGGAK